MAVSVKTHVHMQILAYFANFLKSHNPVTAQWNTTKVGTLMAKLSSYIVV